MKPKIEIWDIAKIAPYPQNVKIHDPKQVAKIAESIKQFGWDQPIVVDQHGVIIKGHGRRLAAISLSMTTAPVWIRDDLTDQQVRASRLADNRAAISNIDSDLFKKEMATLEFDLTSIFDKKELDFMVADLAEFNDEAFVPDLDGALVAAAAETEAMIVAADERPVRIEKALGFKEIKGAAERHVARFIAVIEEQTGLTGADAFVAHCTAVLKG